MRMLPRIVAALMLSVLALPPAWSADFPLKTVRLIVPFPPGGATDALARLMAEKLAERWRQPVVVENKPGGNTVIGTDVVAKAAPDGHVLGIVTGSHIINPMLGLSLPYDTLKDLSPVMMLTRFHMGIYAHPSLAANTPAELLALARAGQAAPAYAAATTQSMLGMALLQSMTGTRLEFVSYKGSAQAINDLLGGHVKLLVDPILLSTLQHVQSGKLKLIATMGAQPAELTPGVPALGQSVRGYDFTAVFGLVTRGGTPPALVQRIRDDIAAVMNLPEVSERIRSIGQEKLASSPEEYNSYILAETAKWAPVVRATGAKAE